MAYESVNGEWPVDSKGGTTPKPTPQEAITGAKRLYRFAFKRPFRGRVKLTSGRRYTWIRSGVLYVNPDCRGGGWHEVVHDLSHYAANRLHPGAAGHGTQHAFLEREMIAFAVRSGFLSGALKRERADRPPVDRKAARAARVMARLQAWERKERRARRAAAKLRAALKRYQKAGIIPAA